MDALGILGGGVAHDLNNMLVSIVGDPEPLLRQIPQDSPVRKPLLTMQKSGEKAAAIVSIG
jgi:signal transduction histidine kinase